MSKLVNISGRNANGEDEELFDLIKEDRYALVWWHPQTLSPAACRTCGDARNVEPIKLLEEIYAGGCDVIGLSYEAPERLKKYLYDIGLVYPVLSVDKESAQLHGAAKSDHEQWQSIPRRIAFLVNDECEIINRYEVNDAVAFLRTVRDDVKAGPPTSKWEQSKRKKFLGIF